MQILILTSVSKKMFAGGPGVARHFLLTCSTSTGRKAEAGGPVENVRFFIGMVGKMGSQLLASKT